MLTIIILFVSTFFSVFHLISSVKYREFKILYEAKHRGVSILVPCYNEELIIKHTVKGLLNINYDDLQVIFINDGSQDNTLEILDQLLNLEIGKGIYHEIEEWAYNEIYVSKLYPQIFVIDKENSGKAESLNTGLKLSKKELIVTMDGDCVLEPNALIELNSQFEDADVIASGGVVHIMQMFKLEKKISRIVKIQALDYIKGFYFYKSSLAYNNALSIISGAFGIFKRSVLCEVGGFRKGLGEDIDITIRFQEYAKIHNKKVLFTKRAICYTECPETFSGLLKQRLRWQKGFIDSIISNARFLFSNIFKNNVCFFIIVDALISNTFATIIFISNMVLLFSRIFYGQTTKYYLSIYFISTILFNIICSIMAIKKAKEDIPELDTLPLYLMIIYDTFIFQILRIVFYVVGIISYYFNEDDWDKVNRTSNEYNI